MGRAIAAGLVADSARLALGIMLGFRSMSRALRRPLSSGLLHQPLRPLLLAQPRAFSSGPLEATVKLYDDLVDKSVKEYQANQKIVGADLDAELATNKLVLFMEGTPDAPKSEPSMNAIKMLTEAQAVP